MTEADSDSDPKVVTASLSDLEGLVRSAFEQARSSKRSDWQRMTTAVLKNRLLQISSRAFDEKSYGLDSILSIAKVLPHLVTVDEKVKPPVLIFSDHLQQLPKLDFSESAVPSGNIRPDLWDSILDFSSPGAYVWDGIAANYTDFPSPDDQVVPTIDAEKLSAWRTEFADAQPANSGAHEWSKGSGGTQTLPKALQPKWNTFLKTKVFNTITAWFSVNSIQPPLDLIVQSRKTAKTDKSQDDVEVLRQYLQSCVSAMRPEELRALQIPASVASRLRK